MKMKIYKVEFNDGTFISNHLYTSKNKAIAHFNGLREAIKRCNEDIILRLYEMADRDGEIKETATLEQFNQVTK